jgi:hypothetical protein
VRVIRSEGADFENFTYQFAPGVGVEPWRLVNVTAYVPARPEDPASHGVSASVDLLSGQRTDIIDDATTGTRVHRERQSTVALRADGGRDIAAVLVPADRAARPGAATDAVVAVLLAQPDGGVRLADVSGAMAHDGPTCGVQVQIARRVLSVQTTDVNATGSVSSDYQFALRAKDTSLRLVALRSAAQRDHDARGRWSPEAKRAEGAAGVAHAGAAHRRHVRPRHAGRRRAARAGAGLGRVDQRFLKAGLRFSRKAPMPSC